MWGIQILIERIDIDRINGIFLEAVKLENHLLLKHNADLNNHVEELQRSIDELQSVIDRQNSEINVMRVGYMRYMKVRLLIPASFARSLRRFTVNGNSG